MKNLLGGIRPGKAAVLTALVLVLAGPVVPAGAQDNLMEARVRRMESEIRAIQRQVFPGSDGKLFAPEVVPAQPAGATPGQGATTPVADLLMRMEALEAQLKQLTAQGELNANRIAKLEAAAGLASPAAVPDPSASPTATANSNLSAMTGGASDANPVTTNTPAPTPSPSAAPTPAPTPTPKPTPSPTPTAAAGPSAQRLAAVRAIVKPQTADPGDDEYSYGFRLWEAKFYPEAQQQLKMMADKYPRHARISFARNLLGRSFLDDGKPREAASWFLQNYQANKTGERASDSLLLLAESMRLLKDSSRACIALAEFGETYPREAAGRLREQYAATRGGLKCN